MIFVIDSCVAVKWFVKEANHLVAEAYLRSGYRLICPDFAEVEVANTLWKKVRNGEIGEQQALEGIKNLPTYIDEIIPTNSLLPRAFELAQLLQHQVFDCIFLAAVETVEGGILVTADVKFWKKCDDEGFGPRVRLLAALSISNDLSADIVEDLVRLYSQYEASIDPSLRIAGFDLERDDEERDALKPHFILPESPSYIAFKNGYESLSLPQRKIILAICSRERRLSNKISFELALFDAEELMDIYKDKIHEQMIYLKYLKSGYRDMQRSRPELFNVSTESSHG